MKLRILTRLAALLLCLCTLGSLASCAGEESEIPAGMKSATCEGADYRLYVPSSWNVNTSYGVSGAYFNAREQSTVSVAKYAITDELTAALSTLDPEQPAARLQYYFDTEVLTALTRVADADTLTAYPNDFADTTLDGVRAKKFHHSAEVNAQELHFLHVVAERANAFYVFSFTATDAHYDSLYTASGSAVKKILKEFKFSKSAYKPEKPVKPLDDDTKAPDGMKLASNKEVAYLFFVPTDWEINTKNEIFSASKDGKAVVSVIPFMPDTVQISVKSYAEKCEADLKASVSEYANLNAQGEKHFKDGKLGGGNALIWEYRYTLGASTYRGYQVMVGYGGMVYSLTYTALDADYDTYWEDAMEIIEAFAFRRS